MASLPHPYGGMSIPSPERLRPTLVDLAERAIEASETFRQMLGRERSDNAGWMELSNADIAATETFRAALLEATGIDGALIRRLLNAGVLY